MLGDTRKLGHVLLLLVLTICITFVSGHVTLRYPPPRLENDFLDNVRTSDICGETRSNSDGAEYWLVSDVNNATGAVVAPGSNLDVSWDLHYAHQGGYKFELYDANLTMVHTWNDTTHFGDDSCPIDGTVQNVTLTMPSEPCPNCILRLLRQANEWGAGYLFKSCSSITIAATADACNGCSGHGECSPAGTCDCTSSAADGFFYGGHCEYENECEADADCGARGKCINIGDVSGPAKQCFCEAGAFGGVSASATGLERRVCDADSALSLDVDTLGDFGAEYERSMESPGGAFSVYWTIGDSEISVAVRAETSSWVGLGMRSVGDAADGGDTAAEGEDGAAAEGEDGATAEGEDDAAAEGEDAAAEPDAEAEADPAANAVAATTAAPEPEAEATPAAPAERRARALSEDDVEDDAAEEEPVAAEGDDATTAASTGVSAVAAEDIAISGGCPAVPAAQVRSVYDLGAGFMVSAQEAAAYAAADGGAAAEGEDGAAAEGEDGAAAEGDAGAAEAPAAEPANRRALAMSRMPSVESEAAVQPTVHLSARKMLQAAAAEAPAADGEAADGEAEDGADAEAEDGEHSYDEGAGKATLSTVASGPCAGALLTPSSSFAMDNQDVVFAVTREVDGVQYHRVVDMFTPSRAKPLPDHAFGGTDDIADAIGVEVEGVTYFKYTRALVSSDPSFADTCFSEDQTYTVVWALGQLTAGAIHVPSSTLEILPSESLTNADFYKADELKFHGGGSGIAAAGIAYDGRGSLGSVNLFVDEAALGGACVVSTEAGFECMQDFLGGTMTLHWSEGTAADTEATIAMELPSETGWAAIGFPATPGTMIGSTAIICTDDAASGECGVYDLNGKTTAAVVEQAGAGRRLSQSAVGLSAAECTRGAGRTLCTVTRSCGTDFLCDGSANDILLANAGSSALGIHSERGPVTLALARSAAGSSGSGVTPLLRKQRAHGWLMGLGWGVILPLGVILANTLRSHGPIWFHLHRAFQVLGLLMTTIGVIIAWTSFEGLANDDTHRRLGIAVMVLGWLQPLNALARPHAPSKDSGESKTTLRLAWEVFHKGVGYVTIALAIWEIFLGLKRAKLFSVVDDNKWRTAYIIVLIILAVFWASLAAMHWFVWSKRSPTSKSGKDSSDSFTAPHLTNPQPSMAEN